MSDQKWVRVGTWLLPQAYGEHYDHFTGTRMAPGQPDHHVPLYAKASDLRGGPYEYLINQTDSVVRAPWTDEQVNALNAWQHRHDFHGYTCGVDHEEHQLLVATPDGWECPLESCNYWQDWAHEWTTHPPLHG